MKRKERRAIPMALVVAFLLAGAGALVGAPNAEAHECEDIVANSDASAQESWYDSQGILLTTCAGFKWEPWNSRMVARGEHWSDSGGQGYLHIDGQGVVDTCYMPNGVYLTYCKTTAYNDRDCQQGGKARTVAYLGPVVNTPWAHPGSWCGA